MIQIGKLLLERGWVEAASVERALVEQPHTGLRLCSMLIARGLLDVDLAARALGEQFGVPAALQRHLEGRDPALARRVPSELARTYIALPLGETRAGQLIVCVRDPSPAILSALTQGVGAEVIMTIAPARVLEALVAQVYGPANEFDVDLSTNPFEVVDPRIVETEPAHDPAEINLGSMTLVELDDDRVSKDPTPTQSGAFALPARTGAPSSPPQSLPARQGTPPPPTVSRTKTPLPPPVVPAPPILPSVPPIAPRTQLARAPSSLELDVSLDDSVADLENAPTRDTATDIAMAFAEARWSSALLLSIREGAALGQRGHGPQLSDDAVHAVTVPLSAASIVRDAHDQRRLITELPSGSGAIQDRLSRLLGQPHAPAAVPVIVGGHVACVLAVGDPFDDGDAAADLVRLATALAAAYERIVRDGKR